MEDCEIHNYISWYIELCRKVEVVCNVPIIQLCLIRTPKEIDMNASRPITPFSPC